MKRLIRFVALLVMLPASLIAINTTSASAMGTWYTLNQNKPYCGVLGHPNWQVIIHSYAVVGNDGVLSRGYILKGANMSWQVSTSCTQYVAKSVQSAYGSYTVSANGYGIDGFSVTAGWPSVSVGGWDKSVRHSLSWTSGHNYGTWSTADDYYFDAGNFGDVSHMRTDVEMTLGNTNQENFEVIQTSGNIQ